MKVFRKAVAFVLALAVAVSLFSVSTSVFAAYKNQLIVDEVEHGSIKIAAPGDNVDDNATVRLWVFPDEGYQVGEWHVYYRSGGKTIQVEHYYDNEYHFVVPKTNRTNKYIIISVTFVKYETVSHTVSVSYSDQTEKGSSVSIDRADGIYAPGETVTVSYDLRPGSRFATDKLNASWYADADKQMVYFQDFPDLTEVSENTYTFTMPPYDVHIQCVFGAEKATISYEKYFVPEGKLGSEMSEEELSKYANTVHDPVTYEYNPDNNLNMRWEYSDKYPKEKYTNDRLRLENSYYESDEYIVSDISLVYYIGDEKTVISVVDWDNVGPNRELTANVFAPGIDAAILVSIDKFQRIDSPQTECGRIVPSISRAVEGDYVYLKPVTEETWELVDLAVTDSRGNTLPLINGNCFVMPDCDVTVTGTWQKEYIKRHCTYTDVDGKVWDMFYSDEFFAGPSTVYNSHLCTLSMYMTKFSMNPDGPSDENDTKYYQGQSDRVHGFFDAIGFTDFEANEDYKKRTAFDTIGIACASRVIGDTTVIAVVPRSGGYYLEWGNNVWLGDGSKSDYMHEGWYNAANKLIAFLKSYVAKYKITGTVKLWMAGFSRGGAVVNIAAGLLDNEPGDSISLGGGAYVDPNDLFAYTFEAPQGANIYSTTVKTPRHYIYNNIFNIINPNDLVPKVAMSQYGFTRFGQDKFITTLFFDPDNFISNRHSPRALYGTMHDAADELTGDHIVMNGITGDEEFLAMLGLTSYVIEAVRAAVNGVMTFVSVDDTKALYDPNIVETIILEELVNAIGTRDDYVRLYQEGMRDLLMAFMSDVKKEDEDPMTLLIEGIIFSCLGDIDGSVVPFGIVAAEFADYLFYSPEAASMESKLVHVAKAIFAERPNELVTMALYIGTIFSNHGTDNVLAHMQAQDFYHTDLYNDTHPRDHAAVIPLRGSADMGRITFDGYNDILVEKDGETLVNVKGDAWGKSKIVECEGGFAVGYYSYAFSEKMELFFPLDTDLTVTFRGYSKKILHEVSYDIYRQYNSVGPYGEIKTRVAHDTDFCSFETDTVVRNIRVTR